MSTNLDVNKLGQQKVLNEKGESLALSSLWQDQTAILIFLRHFGCITCRAHAQEVWEKRSEYQKAGAKIYFIGNGAPYFIGKFKKELKIFEAPVFTDPTLKAFDQAGFKRGLLATLNPTSLKNSVSLLAQGHRQGTTGGDAGDLWQLGGVVVIKPDGALLYHYISEAAGDYPPEKDLRS